MPDDFLRRLLGANRSSPVTHPQTIKLLQSIIGGQQSEPNQQEHRPTGLSQSVAGNLPSAQFANPFANLEQPVRRNAAIVGGMGTLAHEALQGDDQSSIKLTDLSQDERQAFLEAARRDAFDFNDFLSIRNQQETPPLYTDDENEAEQAFRRMIGHSDTSQDNPATPVAPPPESFVGNKTRARHKTVKPLPNRPQAQQQPQAPAALFGETDEPYIEPLRSDNRPIHLPGAVTRVPHIDFRDGVPLQNPHYGKVHQIDVADLVEPDPDGSGIARFKLKAGVTPQQLEQALYERATAQAGFDQESAARYLREKGKTPVGRFFYGNDPSNPTLKLNELMKWIQHGSDGNPVFIYNTPLGTERERQRFLQSDLKEQRAETAQDMEVEQQRQARERTTVLDKAGHMLTQVSPYGALSKVIEPISPEVAKNLRQYEENLLARATLGYVDPTNISIGRGEKNDSIGGEIGGLIGSAVPIVTATAVGGPGAGIAAAGAQPFLERRQGESQYDFETRAKDAALNVMLTAMGGKVSGEELSVLRKIVLDQVIFTGGTAMLKPLTHGEYATWKELGAGAVLGIGMSALHGLKSSKGKTANSQETLPAENQRAVSFEEGIAKPGGENFKETKAGIQQNAPATQENAPIFEETGTHYDGKLRIEKFKNLSPEQRAVEARAARRIENDIDGYVNRYIEKNTKDGVLTLNTDDARDLHPEYAESHKSKAMFGDAVQEPSGAIIKEIFKRELAKPVDPQRPIVMFTAGGGGSGKTFVTNNVESLVEAKKRTTFVYDTTFGAYESSLKKVHNVLDSNRDVHIVMVFTPEKIAAFQAYQRATDSGRTVPEIQLAKDHIGAPETIIKLAEEFKNDPRVQIQIFENKGVGSDIRKMSMDELKQIVYNRNKEKGEVTNHVKQAIRQSHLDLVRAGKPTYDYVYRGFTGEDAPGSRRTNE
jgi:hypothetical protein